MDDTHERAGYVARCFVYLGGVDVARSGDTVEGPVWHDVQGDRCQPIMRDEP